MTTGRRSLEERVQRLEDEREVLRTLHAYADAIDHGDEASFADCWLTDAVLRWPGHPPYRGREAIADVFRRHTHAPEVQHKHLVLHTQLTFDGARCDAHSYYVRLDGGPAGPIVRSFGRYRDVLERCADARWRFRERRAESDASIPGYPSSVRRVEPVGPDATDG